MQTFFKPSSKLLALVMFLPITPSIAAITVFTQSVLIEGNHKLNFSPQHTQRVIDSSKTNN